MNKRSGQNITEFAIIITLVAIVCIVAYTLLGEQIRDLLGNSEKKVKDYKPFGVAYNSDGSKYYKAGSLGGTPAKPVTKCNGNTCIIDYGDFLLTGVPNNFDDYLQSSGSSGGTDQLATLMEQIAQQLEEKGDMAGAQEYRDLANLGHFLSDGQEYFEKQAKICSKDTTPNCMYTKMIDEKSYYSIPNNIKSLFLNDNSKCISPLNFGEINLGRYYKNSNSKAFEPEIRPGHTFIKMYDQIMANTKYSSTMKDVTKQLYQQITRIDQQMNHNLKIISNVTKYPNYDVNGNMTEITTITTEEKNSIATDTFLHPKFSKNVDFKSQLICINGKNTDTGQACQ